MCVSMEGCNIGVVYLFIFKIIKEFLVLFLVKSRSILQFRFLGTFISTLHWVYPIR